MWELIQWPVVFISFCIGIAIVYILQPEPDFVTFFPNPDRAAKTIYEHKEDETCYAYVPNKVSCHSENKV